MSLLEVERVASFYGDFQALFDVSVRVDEGETVAVIGANGAGKSTLLRTVAGLQDRTTGTVSFDGRPLAGVPTHRRLGLGIAMVPEGRRIFPSLTVEENLRVGARRDRPGDWGVGAVLELFPALAGMRDRPGTLLSGGEQQMLAIARALISAPKLLILDEPTEGVAPVLIDRIEDALRLLFAEMRLGVLLIEQNLDFAFAIAQRGYVMEKGQIVLEAPIADLRDDAVERYLTF